MNSPSFSDYPQTLFHDFNEFNAEKFYFPTGELQLNKDQSQDNWEKILNPIDLDMCIGSSMSDHPMAVSTKEITDKESVDEKRSTQESTSPRFSDRMQSTTPSKTCDCKLEGYKKR